MDEKSHNQDSPRRCSDTMRMHERIGFYRPVKISLPNRKRIDAYSGNVSVGGIFLRYCRSIPIGQKVSLFFSTEKGPIQIQEGEVRWTERASGKDTQGMCQVGVQFIKMERESQQNIKYFIEEVLANQNATTKVGLMPDQPYECTTMVDLHFHPSMFQFHPSMFDELKKAGSFEKLHDAVLPALSHRSRVGQLFLGLLLLVFSATLFILFYPLGNIIGGAQQQIVSIPRNKKQSSADSGVQQATEKDTAPVRDNENANISIHEKETDQNTQKPMNRDRSLRFGSGDETLLHMEGDDNANTPDTKQKQTIAQKISKPVFLQYDKGWKMELKIGTACRIRHFSLEQPPRIVIELLHASWVKEIRLPSPTPFIKRARLMNRPNGARLVLFFTDRHVPMFQIDRIDDWLMLLFY